MSIHFQKLPHMLLTPGATISQDLELQKKTASLSDKAETVLTSFKHSRPFSITSRSTVRQINDKMIACGVRMLFVTENDGVIQGLITYTDVFGEKPVLYIQQHGGTREEVLAQDIMTPLLQLEALQYQDVKKANVGDILETVKAAGRQHMLVTDTHANGNQVIVGLFSSTHIEKLLGIKIELSSRANTFADLERALTS